MRIFDYHQMIAEQSERVMAVQNKTDPSHHFDEYGVMNLFKAIDSGFPEHPTQYQRDVIWKMFDRQGIVWA